MPDINFTLMSIFAYIKAQELTIEYSGALPDGEIPWYKNDRILNILRNA